MQRTTEERFWEKVDRRGPNECWEWQAGKNQKLGYGRFYISGNTAYSHRFSYELHTGEIPEGLCVLHSCDNPPCVNPNHLRVGTHKENAEDRVLAGRNGNQNGSKGNNAKLTETEAKAIIEMLKRFPPKYGGKGKGPTGGITQFLGRWFGVGYKAISQISRGKTWKHLDRGTA